jgi:hypothetical protein
MSKPVAGGREAWSSDKARPFESRHVQTDGARVIPVTVKRRPPSSQRAQVVRNIAELPDQLCIAEVAGGRVLRPARNTFHASSNTVIDLGTDWLDAGDVANASIMTCRRRHRIRYFIDASSVRVVALPLRFPDHPRAV